jgi:hypothetical protein
VKVIDITSGKFAVFHIMRTSAQYVVMLYVGLNSYISRGVGESRMVSARFNAYRVSNLAIYTGTSDRYLHHPSCHASCVLSTLAF